MGGIVDTANDLLGGTPSAEVVKAQAFDISGATGTGSFDPKTGEIISTLSPELQALFEQQLQQAGGFLGSVGTAGETAIQTGEGFLSAAQTFDPFAAAEEQFKRLDAILAPGRNAASMGTAGGLLATGRLGSTAGNRVQAETEAAIERERQQLLHDSLASATGVSESLVNRGVTAGAFGLDQKNITQALGLQALGGAFGIDSQSQALLGLGGQLSAPSGVLPGQASPVQSLLAAGTTAAVSKLV